MKRVVSLVVLGLVVSACSPTSPESPTPSGGSASAPAVAASPSTAPSAPAETPGASGPVPSTASPSPTPAPSGTPAPTVPTAWTEVVGQTALAGDQVTGVIAFSGGLLAFGQGEGHVPMWLSKDGRTWDRVPTQPSLSDPNLVVTDVAAGPAGFVAIGETQRSGAALTSPDGLTWQRSPKQASFRPRAGQTIRMGAVVATSSGFVAVGGTVKNVGVSLQAVAPMTWSSTDGRSWKTGAPIAVPGINLAAVTVSPTGLIAIGGPYNPPLATVVFRSTDGRHWKRLPTTGFAGASIQDVTLADGPDGPAPVPGWRLLSGSLDLDERADLEPVAALEEVGPGLPRRADRRRGGGGRPLDRDDRRLGLRIGPEVGGRQATDRRTVRPRLDR